jgi:hypothetical protein
MSESHVCWKPLEKQLKPNSITHLDKAVFVGTGLATGWSPVQGGPTDYAKDQETEKATKVQKRDVEP